VPCGPMDQLASVRGVEGHALFLDCRSLEIEPVRVPAGLQVVAIHSGVARRLAGSEYASRREACQMLARHLGVGSLREANFDQVSASPLGRHVVTENERVLATVDALRRDDRDALGALFAQSHRSLAEDYGVSTPELDRLVEEAVGAGAIACRMTGAGFGGCVVAVVSRSDGAAVLRRTLDGYRSATGREPVVYPCEPSSGAHTRSG
jgi:galactokinase